MNTFNGELPIEVCELARFASDNISRVSLYSRVRIERSGRDESSLMAVASDGHVLGMYTWQATPDTIAGVGDGLCLDGEALKQLAKLARKAKLSTVLLDKGTYTVGGLTGSVLEVEHRRSNVFPDVRQVLPAVGDKIIAEFGVDLELVARVYDCLRAVNKAKTVVKLRGATVDKAGNLWGPCMLEAGDYRFAVMPCRI